MVLENGKLAQSKAQLSIPLIDPDQSLQDLCEIFESALPALGERLGCDRIFLYLRSPQLHRGRVPFCWRRHEDIPLIHDPDWNTEPRSLPNHDPMFAAALRAEPSIFVEDIETASPSVVNREFERQTFGHRALIHAHLCQQQRLWGILQPSCFGRPHPWQPADRALIRRTVGWMTPLAVEYMKQALPASA